MFIKYQTNKPGVEPIVHHLPGTANATYHVGDALYFSSNKLAKATGANAPEYICVAEVAIPSGGAGNIPCVAVEKDSVYETTVNSGTVALGTKYTIHSDAAQITSTSTNGVAEVVGIDGDRIFVKF